MSNVNYGLWYDFRNPEQWRQPFEEFYAERFTQIADAEKIGFGSCWLTEHHFCDDGYTPSPLVLAAAIAARTQEMRLGTNLMLLPLHDPVRVAEDVATLSLLSGGR
ncbi:MAG: alkanesulfonate monooxygenase SsuD, partial [Halioglobus sp.]